MSAFGSFLRKLIRRKPTTDELAAIEDVLDAADAYAQGEMPWQVAANIGSVDAIDWRTGEVYPSTAYARFLAVSTTHPVDPRRRSVTALCDRLVRESGYVVTTHGVFHPQELYERDVTVRSAGERRAA